MVSTPTHDLYGGDLPSCGTATPAPHTTWFRRTSSATSHREIREPAELAEITRQTQEMFSGLTFTMEVGPIVEGDLVSGRWTGRGQTAEGTMSFFGNDILRVDDGRFVEYWTASSPGT